MKEQVTKFNLESAFKALDEIEVPQAQKGRMTPNKRNLAEAFKAKPVTETLLEDYYDVNDSDDLNQAQAEREAEVAKAKLSRIEKIVDLDAETEDDILPNYEGKIIIQCPQCMTLFYKDEADLEYSEEDPNVVNVAEACQHCGNEAGYNVIGKVAAVKEDEMTNYEAAEENIEAAAKENVDETAAEAGEINTETEGQEEPTEENNEEDLNVSLDEIELEDEDEDEDNKEKTDEDEEEKKEESLSANRKPLTEDTNLNEELKIITSLADYKPWEGAISTWETIVENNLEDQFEWMLEDMYPEGLTETQLNDILWFDADWVLESLGLASEDDEEEVDESLKEMYEPVESFKSFEFKDKTNQGFEVVKTFLDNNDRRLHVIVYRPAVNTYAVGLGYTPDEGYWNQGWYDFSTAEEAEEALKRRYDVTEYFYEAKKEETPVKENGTKTPLKEMIIDAILDRKDGDAYNPREFYDYVSAEEANFGFEPEISRALDSGTNEDVQAALCKYITDQEYNPAICDYVKSVNWLEESVATTKKAKSLREEFELSKSEYKTLIGDYFNHTLDFKFLDVVAGVLNRVEDFSNDNTIIETIDSSLVYDDDIWTVIKFYCAPTEANWENAYEDFTSDILKLCSEIHSSVANVEESLNESKAIKEDAFDELMNSDEFKEPITDEEVRGYLDDAKDEGLMKKTFEDLEEVEEEPINKYITESLKEVYSNIKNFKLTEFNYNNNKVILEGKINFKSGKSKNTKFVFTELKQNPNKPYLYSLRGTNKGIAEDSKFALNFSLKESLTNLHPTKFKYSYKIGENLVEGFAQKHK